VVLPAPGRGDRKLQPGTRCAHLADQRSLPSIQGGFVRRHLQQSQIHRRLVDGCPVAASRGDDQAPFCVENPLGGVQIGARDGVDGGPVDPPQHFRFLDAVVRPGQGNRPTIEHLIDEQVH